MLDIFKTFATDGKKEQEGAWVEIGQGASLLVARSTNRRFLKATEAEVREHKEALDKEGDEAEKVQEEILARTFAEGLLLGWKGIAWKGQADVPYSKELAIEMLHLPDFRKLVARIADDRENFLAAAEEEIAKN